MNNEWVPSVAKRLLDRGYRVFVNYSGDTAEISEIEGGDCNCPCPKHYDPEDGYGFTLVDDRNVPSDLYKQGLQAVGEWMVEYVLSIEGKPTRAEAEPDCEPTEE